jgi:hypothetical protein
MTLIAAIGLSTYAQKTIENLPIATIFIFNNWHLSALV